ncbi:MAG: DEAD/DEAH box helicase, partial [Propionibacteriaceae bacterium]|nr:DEAD/DEAH box helicase [Propionibacteriaceae bacterium]
MGGYNHQVPLNALTSLFAADPAVARCLERAKSGNTPALDITLIEQARPLLFAALALSCPAPFLAVTSTFRQAENLVEQIGEVLGEEHVAYYPAWETLPHERLSPRSDTVGRRLEVLRRLKGADELPMPKVVVAPVRALMQPQVKGIDQLRPVRLVSGADYDLTEVAAQLAQVAYIRTDMVERRGEFSLRGGILDVFPPTAEHPVRVDFFGDTIEEIRTFGIADQLSFGQTLPEVFASPCRELLLTDEVRRRAGDLASNYPDDPAELGGEFAKIAQGLAPEGMEALAPALVGEMELLVDVLPSGSTIVIVDPDLTRSRAKELHTTSQEFLHASWVGAASGGKVPIDFESSAYWTLAAVRSHALGAGQRWWLVSPFENEEPHPDAGESHSDGEHLSGVLHASAETAVVKALELPNWRGDTEAAVIAIDEALTAKHQVVLLAETKGLAKRLAEILGDSGIEAPISDDNSAVPPAGQAWILVSGLSHGFVMPDIALDVYSLGDLAGSKGTERAARKMPARRKKQIDPVDLSFGDAVVHEHHGVGRYKEMVTRTVQGITREYLVVEFAPGKRGHPRDQLFVPVDQLHLLTPYVGGEAPALDKLGGADWARRKARARRAVKEIAQELIRLYAARQSLEGYAFGPDTAWQGELEDSFAFIETPDQLSAISDVKADMERTIPMDRLICGDVGYGKTEIAVRAAFKAVMDSKQVAILVPTTLLVQQHFNTFSQRYAGFPMRVASLSRFQTEKERKRVIADLESGAVDVVIGTHRLLGAEVKFRDLGLVVIDEEQRFGVEHKE